MTNSFSELGYERVDIASLTGKITALRAEILGIFDIVSRQIRGVGISTDRDIVDFYRENPRFQHLCVKHARYCRSLFDLTSDPLLFEIIRTVGGLEFPVFEVNPIIRCDMGVEKQPLFLRHQDYPYNMGSANSVTLWIPLQDTTKSMGALKIAPGSHKQGPVPHVNGLLPMEMDIPFQQVEVRLGQALLFNQCLFHESGENQVEDRIRFSAIMRISDLREPTYAGRGFPLKVAEPSPA